MAEIQRLSSDVIDQIAAGEVVERPSHMVKELLENAIDAKATEIQVSFSQGGKSLVIIDNGHGMSKEDLPLALARHATSKITSGDDLWHLNSFGFRGEALASISAVAKLEIRSRRSVDKRAHVIASVFGKVSEVKACGGEVGTRIEISSLFENVPARLKFLKSDGAESTQIKMVVKAVAIAHPEVSFRVTYNDKLLYLWPAEESYLKRAEQILNVLPLYYGEGECQSTRARVCISAPNKTQKTSRNMWFFVQNRWIQDRSLQASVMDAYRSLLMHGEFPSVTIWLDVDSEEVDVNVHPTKSQVKFRNQSDAFRAVNRAVKSVLNEAPWLVGVKPQQKQVPSSIKQTPRPTNLEFSQAEFSKVQFAKPKFNPTISSGSPATGIEDLVSAQQQRKVDYASAGFDSSSVEVDTPDNTEVQTRSKGQAWSNLQILGQAGLTYILCENDSSLILIDQHAAHERVAYERLMEAWKLGGIETQNLLVPLSLQMDEDRVEAVLSHVEDLAKMGLVVESTGPESLVVTSLPSVVKERAVVKTLHYLADEIMAKGGSFAWERTLSDLAATMACHSVIRAGQALSHEEMLGLLMQMDEFPHSSFCPHGRPVYVEYNFSKIEKDFGRIV